ncbi:coiled-coil domain-containing protein 39-like [Cheilinus undulatus]|uniref:coiled-coil domain-containing protein 39-like n=1 Tax=Cheilinus undulatus TaxID=241271 RepID=UPI001BD5BB2F|nr:coiled-coil domain-containing protein 39-like [Cheilinus undulatus]
MLSTMKDLLVKRDNLERSLKKHSDEHDSLKKHAVKMKQEVSYDEERLEGLKRKCEQHMSRLEKYRLYQESKLTQLEDLRQQVASASEEYDQKSGHVAQVEAELQRERNREQQLESDMKKAASILRRIVMASEEKEKTELLLRVQKVLERDLPEDIDSTLTHYILTSCGGNTPQTTDAELTREETVKMATDPLFLLARSRPGDLGIIPRPSWEQ